jgi:hypothetical protein
LEDSVDSNKWVLLLIGSAKQPHSTSESLGTHLLALLEPHGFDSEILYIHKSLKCEDSQSEFLSATRRADLIVLAFPLYADCLPYLVIRALELIADDRRQTNETKTQSLLAVVNCGFPESQQNDTAVAICRRFAKETGFRWAGALALGGGEAINGQPLSKVKGMARNAIKSLELAAKALVAGDPVPQRAIDLMAKPFMPKWLYMLGGSWRFKSGARKYGMRKSMKDRPFQSR